MERGVGALRHSAALEQAGLHCRELRMSNFLPNFSHRKSLFAEKLCTEGLSGNLLPGWVTETSHLLQQENKSP